MDNKQIKRIRKIKDDKNATKSKGQPEFKLNQKEQYILNRSNQALGVAKTNQGAVNDINVSIEANTNRINMFDDKMKKWDNELIIDLKNINDKMDTLIDVIIDLVDPNDIDDTILKKLGLESVEIEEVEIEDVVSENNDEES